jgi:hypothetical protein
MNYSVAIWLAGAVLGISIASHADPARQSILGYHGDPARSGNFVVPPLTWDRARSLHFDENFRTRVSGHVYAQPLYWHPPGSELSSNLGDGRGQAAAV